MKTLLYIIATLLLFAACKREPKYQQPPDNWYFLSAEQIAKTPYFTNPAFDTISFTSNKGDTLIFRKTKTDTTYYKTYGQHCPDCPEWTNYHQTLRNTYQTLKGNGKFEVRHMLNDDSYFLPTMLFTFNNLSYRMGEVWLNRPLSYQYSYNEILINILVRLK